VNRDSSVKKILFHCLIGNCLGPCAANQAIRRVVGNHNRHIHRTTVRNRLREFGQRARRPYIDFPLTRARRARRMAWLAAHGPRQFPMRQWRRIFFTDESMFFQY
jgi:hypothetical protein